MCDQLGEEPIESKCPPDFDDFPDIVQTAIIVFNKLGDRVYPDIGYVGKDYTLLDAFIKIYCISNKELFLEVICRLDSELIERSNEQMKRARESAKKKSSHVN